MISRRPRAAMAFLAPAVAFYLLVVIYPLISSARLSVTDSPAGNPGNFVGLDEHRFVSTAKEMPRQLVPGVVAHRIGRLEPGHRLSRFAATARVVFSRGNR